MSKLTIYKGSIYLFLNYVLFLSFSLSNLLTFAQVKNISGVKFNSLNVGRPGKTSVYLNEYKPIQLNSSFSISFKISFWNPTYYGPIIRIDDEKDNELRLLYNYNKNKPYSLLTLISNKLDLQVQVQLPKAILVRNNWFIIKLNFDKLKEVVSIFIDNTYEGQIPYPLKDTDSFKFAFGLKDLNNPQDFDVPGMSIKDILITELDKEKYFWSLNPAKSSQDEISGSLLEIVNPNWVSIDHFKWRHLVSFSIFQTSESPKGVAHDSLNSNLFIDTPDSLIIYNIITGIDSVVKYKRKSPAIWNDLFYDPENQVLYSYKTGKGKVSIYDIRKNEWSINDASKNTDGHYFGSAKFNPGGDNLYLLGGYGWKTVKKDLFKYDFNRKDWVKIELKRNDMTPRAWFSFGNGFKHGEYIIYGGIGNESGVQDYGFSNYYDLFILNMNDSTISKVNLKTHSEFQYSLLLPGSYLDIKDSLFYFISALEDNKSLQLFLNRMDLRNGIVSQVGNKFWQRKSLKWIYSDLYFNKSTNELISVIFDSTDVEIHAITYPPTDSIVYYSAEAGEFSNSLMYFIIFSTLISGSVVFLIYRKRKRSHVKTNLKQYDIENKTKSNSIALKNHIKLFGGFCIYDNEGKNIIQNFSPKLREILLLIIIRSMNHQQNKGISSEELSATIWPDASQESSKTNRGVAINRIRKMIKDVKGVEILFVDKRWKIEISDEASCDYLEFLKLREIEKFDTKINLDSLFDVLGNDYSREFLKGLSYEWLDTLKFSINNDILAFLKQLIASDPLGRDKERVIKICDIIMSFDSVDQDAFKLKIKSLTESGKFHIAKNTYDLFVAEYKRLYDENYPISLENLMNS